MPRSQLQEVKKVFLDSIFPTDSEELKVQTLLEIGKEYNLSVKAFETLRRQLID